MLFLKEVWANIRDYFRHGTRAKSDQPNSPQQAHARGLTEAARDAANSGGG